MKSKRRSSIKLLLFGLFGSLLPNPKKSLENPTNTSIQPPKNLRIAYVLFDGITLLDFVGIYDPISRIKAKGFIEDLSWDLCAMTPSIKDGFGLQVSIDKIKPDLSDYDMIIIPGGFGTRSLQFDSEFVEWIQTARDTKYKVSICTGSLLLGAAGFLENKIATTNFKEYKTLEKYCRMVSKDRIVDDHNTITAGAVASSLDIGLYICEKLVGKENTEIIRTSMDYIPSDFQVNSK